MKTGIYLRHFASAFLLMLAYSLVTSGLALMVLPVVNTFGFSRGAFTLCSTLLMLPGLALSPFLGTISQRLGLRKMILLGALWGALALGLLPACRTLPQF